MDDGEIEVPKSVRPIMLDAAQETRLGERRGAKKQYRYGNLHIREYDDKYVVHVDKVDPRKDPLGHLLKDSPETLLGIASGIYFGKKVGSEVYSKRNGRSGALLESLLMGSLGSLTAGYLGYKLGKQLKDRIK
jgi:hypothetical protein